MLKRKCETPFNRVEVSTDNKKPLGNHLEITLPQFSSVCLSTTYHNKNTYWLHLSRFQVMLGGKKELKNKNLYTYIVNK